MNKINIIITFLAAAIWAGCATYKPQYKDSNWQSQSNTNNTEIDETFYLISDLGFDAENNAISAFKNYLTENATEKDHVLFLGNSFINSGNNLSKNDIEQQLAAITDFKGTVYFVPGEGEWQHGVDGLEDIEDLLKEVRDQEDILEPNNGCPLKSIEIGDDVQLIIADTQWYLADWDEYPEMNDKCMIKTRSKFFIEIEGELKKNKEKTILFAMHHPILTNGPYGGKFSLKNHLLPLPGLGTFITQIRNQGAIDMQDRYNERYAELMSRMEVLAKDHDRLVFVSGHDRSLQYIDGKRVKQIVSGGGSKPTPASVAEYGKFSYGGLGFSRLDVLKNGASQLTMLKANEDGTTEVLYQKEILPQPRTYNTELLPDTFPQTMQASVYDDSLVNRTGFFKTLWGAHYREVYGKKVTAPVALLDTLYGGLTVERAGGGHQTVSLRLKGKGGRDYNMRALKKSAVQFIQTVLIKDKVVEVGFEDTVPEDLILDFYTAAHPYGAFTIPPLADAAGVFHTNPKLYYVPKQPALGKFNETYGDALYMIVERPDEEYDGAIFDYADDIESTDDMLDKLRSDEENILDERAYMRARIFDMLIGDWDRHNDQWRFAEYKKDNGTDVFVPIPRDRDQVYANFDGGLLNVVRTLFNTARQFQVYGAELEHTKWFNSAGIKLDRAFIENYGREGWLEEAAYIQQNVTDEVIEEAFRTLPKEVQDASAEQIKTHLKGRRDNIVKIAGEYYDYFSKLQTVTGTDKDDYIEIIRMPNGRTQVIVSRIKDGEKGTQVVNRTYDKKDTKELWVYGLDDDDIFEVKGDGDSPIFTRIIGGQNNDTYRINNGRAIKVYDQRSKKNTIEERGGAAFRLTDNYNFNTYNYLKEKKTTNLLLPSIGFNPDDGFLVGLSDVFTVQGFQQNPFAQQHRLSAGYYFATSSFNVEYMGEFANIFGQWNFLLGGEFRNPNFAENYFGFGNETENLEYDFPDMFDRDYNRVRIGKYGGSIGVQRDSPYGSLFRFQAKYEAFEVEGTPNRFITDNPPIELDETKSFASVEGTYEYESLDNAANPTRGMFFHLTTGGTQNTEDSDRVFGYVIPQLRFYNALSADRKFVLKTQAVGQFNVGNNFEFYQGAQLGRDYGLRGYRRDRFTGRSAVAGNADLRYSFNSFKTGLAPVQIGIFGGYDIGRVWVPNDTSDVWHSSYGGGFWLNIADLVSGTVNAFASDEGLQFSFSAAISM